MQNYHHQGLSLLSLLYQEGHKKLSLSYIRSSKILSMFDSKDIGI